MKCKISDDVADAAAGVLGGGGMQECSRKTFRAFSELDEATFKAWVCYPKVRLTLED